MLGKFSGSGLGRKGEILSNGAKNAQKGWREAGKNKEVRI